MKYPHSSSFILDRIRSSPFKQEKNKSKSNTPKAYGQEGTNRKVEGW